MQVDSGSLKSLLPNTRIIETKTAKYENEQEGARRRTRGKGSFDKTVDGVGSELASHEGRETRDREKLSRWKVERMPGGSINASSLFLMLPLKIF